MSIYAHLLSGDDERAAKHVQKTLGKRLAKEGGQEPKITRAFARSPKQPRFGLAKNPLSPLFYGARVDLFGERLFSFYKFERPFSFYKL